MIQPLADDRNPASAESGGDRKTRERIAETDAFVHTNDDTVQLPPLDPDAIAAAAPTLTVPERESPASSAESWARNVEAELDRLQRFWKSIDANLVAAHNRAASLQTAIEQRNATIAEALAELDSRQRRIDALGAVIAERDIALASLEQALRDRDAQLAEAAQALVQARTRAEILQGRLEAAMQEIKTLRGSLQTEKHLAADLRAENEAAESAGASLRAKLHDLEVYIDGRRDLWVEQQALLQSYSATISGLEADLEDGERRIAGREAVIETLEARIRELEREAGELVAQRKEQEARNQEARKLLDERAGEIERLRGRVEQEFAAAGKALAEASRRGQDLDALRAAVADKDASIRHLETELGKLAAVMAHVEGGKRDDRRMIDELQHSLAELRAQRDASTASLEDARAELRALEQKLAEADGAAAQLRSKDGAQQERIAALEAELEARAATIAGLEARAERLRQLSRSTGELSAIPLDLERVPEAFDERNPHDLLEAEELFDDEEAQEHIETQTGDHGPPTSVSAETTRHPRRRMLVSLTQGSGDGPVYPLLRPITTIGRSRLCDIRIQDVVISRVHARLKLEGDRVIVEDASSKNGLLVNFKPIEQAVLAPGDVICLGMHEFRYVELEQPTHTH